MSNKEAAETLPSHWGGTGDRTEKLSPVPIEAPINVCKPEPLHVLLEKYMAAAIAQRGQDDLETPEEAMDFEPEDDEGLLDLTPYELVALKAEEAALAQDHAEIQQEGTSEAPQEPKDDGVGSTPTESVETPSGAST